MLRKKSKHVKISIWYSVLEINVCALLVDSWCSYEKKRYVVLVLEKNKALYSRNLQIGYLPMAIEMDN